MKLILPKALVPPEQVVDPIIFLGGPINGGGNWQQRACEYLMDVADPIIVAVPCRWGNDHPMYSHRLSELAGGFDRQVLWERYYLDQAAYGFAGGCVAFWLPQESAINPRDDGQPYARDTYGELGAWRTKLSQDSNLRLVIGAESEFPGLDVFKCNLIEDAGYEYHIHSSLEQTLDAAVRIAVSSRIYC